MSIRKNNPRTKKNAFSLEPLNSVCEISYRECSCAIIKRHIIYTATLNTKSSTIHSSKMEVWSRKTSLTPTFVFFLLKCMHQAMKVKVNNNVLKCMHQAMKVKVNNNVFVGYGYPLCLFLRFLDWNLDRCGINVFGGGGLCMFFFLAFQFFHFQTIYCVIIIYLCQLGITTAVQTEKYI